MHQRDARRTRHHTPVTLMSRRLHDTFEQSTHTHDQEPIDDYHTTLSDKCNDRHKACRPHLSHNVLHRYPLGSYSGHAYDLHGSSDTHVSCTGRGVGDTLPSDHTRVRSRHTSDLSRWRQGWQAGLTKATHESAREGGASRDSPMRLRDARRTRHHPSVTLIRRRLHTRVREPNRYRLSGDY